MFNKTEKKSLNEKLMMISRNEHKLGKILFIKLEGFLL